MQIPCVGYYLIDTQNPLHILSLKKRDLIKQNQTEVTLAAAQAAIKEKRSKNQVMTAFRLKA